VLILNLLGNPEVICGNTDITRSLYKKSLAILAYLATETGLHRREALSDLLWPSLSMEAALSNLRKTIFRLRQALGESDGLQVNANTLQLTSGNLCLDTTEFLAAIPGCETLPPSWGCSARLDRMERGADLYRAPFLNGLLIEGVPDFDDWLNIKRETYHRMMLGKLEHLTDCHQKNGDLPKALRFANRLIELEPLDEAGHRRLIRLLAQSGQKSAALAHYHTCCRLLERELGVKPEPQTIALFEQIKGGEFLHEASPPAAGSVISEERRQVTVLYCRVRVTDTGDTEDIPERWSAIQHRIQKTIREQGGHISQMHGGAVLGYFGYPVAQEDAARRAVRAALALHALEDDGIRISTGLHTGLTITGTGMPDMMGQTSIVAEHMQNLDRSVVISEATQRLVEGYFHITTLGPHQVNGVLKPMRIFRVTGESRARHRLEAAKSLTPLVGRTAEIDELLLLWEKARQGTMHIVLIQGEAGIGKSRLVHALQERLDKDGCVITELRCFPEFSHSPLRPLVTLIESLCGFRSGDSPDVRMDKLVHFLRTHYPRAGHDAAPLLAGMLSLPCDEPLNLPPAKQREKLNALLIRLLQMLAARQPVLYIIEDLHWIDPSTLELLTTFINGQHDMPILMLLTARPEFDPPWMEDREISMELSPMDDSEVTDIVTCLGKDILPELIRDIVARADGIPLFAEEMAKMTQQGWTTIPASLRDLLTVKLDGLGAEKRTAQLAASIGREFDFGLLCAISPHVPMLKPLQESGLISSRDGDNGFQFRHVLIQEVAYQSQIKADRQAAHRSIAEALQKRFANPGEALPEIIAQHLASAGEAAQSAEYWFKAGKRSMLNSANVEAIEHTNRGLQQLRLFPPGEDRDSMEIRLSLVLGTALIASHGFGSVNAGEAYSRALGLSEKLGDHSRLHQSLWGMWLVSSSLVNHTHSLELATRLLRLAQQVDDVLQLQQAHYAMGNSQLWTGHPDKGRYHLETGMALYQPSHHRTMVSRYGENVRLSSGSLLAFALWILGFPDQATSVCDQNIALARKLKHPFSLGYTVSTASIVHRWLKQTDTVDQLAGESMAVSDEFGMPFWLCMGSSSAGWVTAMRGEFEGIARMRQSVDAVDTLMSGTKLLFMDPLCEALVHLRQFDEGLKATDEALNIANEKNDRFLESAFHRLKGECLLGISAANLEESRSCFDRALEIGRRQGAKSLELRAAISLARHFGDMEPLAQAYSWFTEGFDTADLVEARDILLLTQ